MKNVLIASAYHESDEPIGTKQTEAQTQVPNQVWLKLQKEFIKRNTTNYDFAVFLNNISDKTLFQQENIIGEHDVFIKDARASHRVAIREIIQYFRDNQDKYNNFCLLDSDCFPIKKGWVGKLNKYLRVHNLKFSAIMRVENGETFPHPAALIIPRKHINEDIFHFPEDFEDGVKNIINGTDIHDTGAAMTFWDQEGNLMGHPLLRSNVINLHPIYAGVYGDLFYHHGLGSRIRKIGKKSRAIEPLVSFKAKPYWNDYGNYRKDFWIFFDLIMKRPQKFINTLRGDTLRGTTIHTFFDHFDSNAIVAQLNIPLWK